MQSSHSSELSYSTVRQRDETKVLYAVASVPVESVDSDDILAGWDFLLDPVQRHVTGPIVQVLLVPVDHFQPIDSFVL